MVNGIPLPPLFLGRCRCRVIYNFRLRGYFTFNVARVVWAKPFDRLAGIPRLPFDRENGLAGTTLK